MWNNKFSAEFSGYRAIYLPGVWEKTNMKTLIAALAMTIGVAAPAAAADWDGDDYGHEHYGAVAVAPVAPVAPVVVAPVAPVVVAPVARLLCAAATGLCGAGRTRLCCTVYGVTKRVAGVMPAGAMADGVTVDGGTITGNAGSIHSLAKFVQRGTMPMAVAASMASLIACWLTVRRSSCGQRRPLRPIIRMGCKPIRCTAAALAPSITSLARREERFGPGALPSRLFLDGGF